jgi:hypothetical protein
MTNRAGAGAAVSSGANFQARVAAYLIVAAICDLETSVGPAGFVKSFSFETFEAVDDINLGTSTKSHVYIQAKASIALTFEPGGEMRKVFAQFEAQHAAGGGEQDRYILITSARASRTVTGDLRAALSAFRTADDKAFRRDQPRALQNVIAAARSAVQSIARSAGRAGDAEYADAVLRKSEVIVLDLESGGSLEEGVKVLLAARNYVAPSAVWGKIVADCVEHAKARSTFSTENASATYSRFLRPVSGPPLAEAAEDLMRIDLSNFVPPVQFEVVLGRTAADGDNSDSQVRMIELCRFAADGTERTIFQEEECVLPGGERLSLIRRAATMEGMARLLAECPDLISEEAELVIQPLDEEEAQDEADHLEIHRERLRDALNRNPHPLRCLNCAKPIFTEQCSVIEAGTLDEILVGLVHAECVRPADRVLGGIRSQMFAKHPELVHFDVSAWVRALENGQQTFRNAEYIRAGRPVVLAWNDPGGDGPPGDWIVETSLTNGDRVIATQRNHVHRFGRAEAEAFASSLDAAYDRARSDADPFCYSDQTLAFGRRSQLLEMIGVKERITPVDRARARRYDARFAARFERAGLWYAPLVVLRNARDGGWVTHDGQVLAVTDPLALARHISNWREAGIDLPPYETVSLLSDQAFDAFMRSIISANFRLSVDPLFDPSSKAMVGGLRLISMDDIDRP